MIDDSFYELFMESEPYKLWKIKEKSDWNHKWISERISWNEHEEGEVLFTFDDTTDLWNDIKINNLSLGEILKQSIIAEINY